MTSLRGIPDNASRAAGRIAVLACPRSALDAAPLPPETILLELPCVGRVSVPLLLALLGQRAQGVLVLGRHPETCRLGQAETLGRERTLQVSRFLELLGADPGRVAFALSDPGPEGARRSVESFTTRLHPLLPGGRCPTPELPARATEGLDSASILVQALIAGQARAASAPAWLAEHGLPAAAPGRPALLGGPLPPGFKPPLTWAEDPKYGSLC